MRQYKRRVLIVPRHTGESTIRALGITLASARQHDGFILEQDPWGDGVDPLMLGKLTLPQPAVFALQRREQPAQAGQRPPPGLRPASPGRHDPHLRLTPGRRRDDADPAAGGFDPEAQAVQPPQHRPAALRRFPGLLRDPGFHVADGHDSGQSGAGLRFRHPGAARMWPGDRRRSSRRPRGEPVGWWRLRRPVVVLIPVLPRCVPARHVRARHPCLRAPVGALRLGRSARPHDHAGGATGAAAGRHARGRIPPTLSGLPAGERGPRGDTARWRRCAGSPSGRWPTGARCARRPWTGATARPRAGSTGSRPPSAGCMAAPASTRWSAGSCWRRGRQNRPRPRSMGRPRPGITRADATISARKPLVRFEIGRMWRRLLTCGNRYRKVAGAATIRRRCASRPRRPRRRSRGCSRAACAGWCPPPPPGGSRARAARTGSGGDLRVRFGRAGSARPPGEPDARGRRTLSWPGSRQAGSMHSGQLALPGPGRPVAARRVLCLRTGGSP